MLLQCCSVVCGKALNLSELSEKVSSVSFKQAVDSNTFPLQRMDETVYSSCMTIRKQS